jgi:hypothetical protein
MRLIFILIFFTVLSIGCSGISHPVAPKTSPTKANLSQTSYHSTWGIWQLHVSADHTRIEVVPYRIVEYHFCVTPFMEQFPCNDCLSIWPPAIQPDGTLKVQVTLKHPLPIPRFTGFDVRGMVYFPATQEHETASLPLGSRIWKMPYPSGGIDPGFMSNSMPLNFSRADDGGGEVLNADGYSCYLIPGVTYSKDWPIFSYQPGKFGIEPTPQYVTVNPYKLFASDDERRMFLASDVITREYHIALPKGPFTFGYAVDASWWPPDKIPVTDPATDFPREANAEDPWKIEYEQLLPICEENVGKHIFKVTAHHRGIDDKWYFWIFAWDVSQQAINCTHALFASGPEDVIDDFTTAGYFELRQDWWWLYGQDGKIIPGHHLGVLMAIECQQGNPDVKAQLRQIYGPKIIDIYVQE